MKNLNGAAFVSLLLLQCVFMSTSLLVLSLLIPFHCRLAWAEHFQKDGVDFVFFSAKQEQEQIDEQERLLHGMLGAEAAQRLGMKGMGHLTALEAFVAFAPYLAREKDPREDSLLDDQLEEDSPAR